MTYEEFCMEQEDCPKCPMARKMDGYDYSYSCPGFVKDYPHEAEQTILNWELKQKEKKQNGQEKQNVCK